MTHTHTHTQKLVMHVGLLWVQICRSLQRGWYICTVTWKHNWAQFCPLYRKHKHTHTHTRARASEPVH